MAALNLKEDTHVCRFVLRPFLGQSFPSGVATLISFAVQAMVLGSLLLLRFS